MSNLGRLPVKTPDEIKRGLEMCQHGEDCGHCPYTLRECLKHQMERDALAYIQQLERENAQKEERIKQLERERDAAIKGLTLTRDCKTCGHFGRNSYEEPCRSCGICQRNWEWRGVEEDEQ